MTVNSVPEPQCETCRNHGLLNHEWWCTEGHGALRQEVIALRQRETELRNFVLWMADCHAATTSYDGMLRSASKSRRWRFVSICRDAAEAIGHLFGDHMKRRYEHKGRHGSTAEDVRDRLLKAVGAIEAEYPEAKG